MVLAVLAKVEPACARTLAALALAKAAITLVEFADKEDSSANGIPPDVVPSWTTIVFFIGIYGNFCNGTCKSSCC